MKLNTKGSLTAYLLIVGICLLLADWVRAQVFTTLYNFQGGTNAGQPYSGLIFSDNRLYGATTFGGLQEATLGTIFSVNVDGSGFTNIHSFTPLASVDTNALFTNSDGIGPYAALVLSGKTLFGSTIYGGSGDTGVLFRVNTDGSEFTNLHNFPSIPSTGSFSSNTNTDGARPIGGLTLVGNILYGVTEMGGGYGYGTVFAINTDGSNFTNLYNFTGLTDGGQPMNGLVISGVTLYGTTFTGGNTRKDGIVFAINTDGSGFTNLHSFGSTSTDGIIPLGRLISLNNRLYGVTSSGGSANDGTIFALNIDGSDYTNLHNFAATMNATNYEGDGPKGLILSGNTFYGIAGGGGNTGNGTIFVFNLVGGGISNLHNFSAVLNLTNSGGSTPLGGLTFSNNILYGTAQRGGTIGQGTVFSLSFATQLSISASSSEAVLAWPANMAGYTLQSSTNLGKAANWITVSPAPVQNEGRFIVTNSVSSPRMYYRLSQ